MLTRIYDMYITLTFKVYNKMRRVTDIISHSSSERRSILNTSRWSKLSNVTGCFTAGIGAHSPAVELENAIQFRIWSGPLQGVSRTCETAANTPAVSVIVFFKTRQGLECQHVASMLTYTIGLLYPSFVLEPISDSNHIVRKKAELLFSKFKIGNQEQGWSQVFFFFFSIWVFFDGHSRITGLQGKGEGISLIPHYHFHPLHSRHLDISQAITAESSPLYIGSSRT